jgi:hypothetical protein
MSTDVNTKEQMERLRRRLELFDRRLLQIQFDSATDDPESVTDQIEMLRGNIREPSVPMEYRRACETKMVAIEREAYTRNVSGLLDRAIEGARAGDEKAKAQHLTQARSYFAIALRLGAGEEFKETVRKKIEIVLATTATGTSERAKKTPTKLSDTKAVADDQKLRRFTRFADPRLTVGIGTQNYQTVDWSLGGLLVANFTMDLFPDTQILLTISIESDDFKHKCPSRVVSIDSGKQTLAVRFDAGASALLPIMDRCRKLGITPRD